MTISVRLRLQNDYKDTLVLCKWSFERSIYFSEDTKAEKSNLQISYKQGPQYIPAKNPAI